MVTAMHSISTRTPGWREECWAWAETHQHFELLDIESPHFMFCQELCAEYNYRYVYRCLRSESVARFIPVDG
ncbi:MAG TPA: hypothetical protein VH251_01730 [Verrucomicrobiae bacterium]|jgi:hypothetical protein|nr:hypothetical protein [Verrucomicrobiae bacterium]